MSNQKYHYMSEVINDKSSSYVPDVAFHPNGTMYAVSYRDNNEVRIYESSNNSLLRTYSNPQSLLSFPHGITFTDRHIIVSNKLNSNAIKPSNFTVYRIDDPSIKPVSIFETPLEQLLDAHSLDVSNGKLLVAYAGKKKGAVVTYNFDDNLGIITGPTSILDGFSTYGEPKGICFNEDGSKIIITIASDNPKHHQHHFTGLAIFDVDENGKLSKEPAQIIHKPNSRLENINIVDDKCVVADPINDCVYIYQLDGENDFDHPLQIIKDRLSFPHDACLSPDKKLLIVTSNGLKVVNRKPQWGKFHHPRSDKFTIFKLS